MQQHPPRKSPSNPLLAPAAAFSLSDSFGGGAQPALLVPSAPANATHQSSASGFLGGGDHLGELQSSFNLDPADLFAQQTQLLLQQHAKQVTPTASLSASSSASSLTSLGFPPPPLPAAGQQIPRLGPPAPGVFLLPAASVPLPPTTGGNNSFSLGGGARKPGSRYVAPPGIASTSADVSFPGVSGGGASDLNLSSYNYGGSTLAPGDVTIASGTSLGITGGEPSSVAYDSSGYDVKRTGYASQPVAATSHAASHPAVPEVAHHWFYMVTVGGQEQWKPFTMIDSVAIDEVFLVNPNAGEPIPTDGGRYDVTLPDRKKASVYWSEDPLPIRRCSWFYRSNSDGRWTPYSEEISQRLEDEYASAASSGLWNRRLELGGSGEHVALHSPAVMMHFPRGGSEAGGGHLDDWGQVQPQDPEMKPRVVHRGLEGLPDIPDGEVPEVDHLVFMVHGIGSACDIKFRSITEVVDGFRHLTAELSERHFQSAHLSGKVSRVEYLPVNWHTTLHGEDTGTDERLEPLTLKSIPKLRNFVNDTLLDILFYTSPVYCQRILDTVVLEINRMYTLFMVRNENFRGAVSLMGHSLGSLILFDVLTHQSAELNTCSTAATASSAAAPTLSRQQDDDRLDLVGVFAKLGISEFADNFTSAGIDLNALLDCTEEDLAEGGLPQEHSTKLRSYLETRKNSSKPPPLSGLEEFQRSSVTEDVKFVVGPAGTGQPCVQYPRLCFQPSCFYALGSPISMFLAVRGIESLGASFKFPTCPRFFNIFHPYDPVAYRVESLIKSEYARLRPVVVPHHKGRKRMHLELKDTVTKLMTTDIKQKIIDSVSATLSTVYNIATGSTAQEPVVQRALEDSMSKHAQEAEEADESNPRVLEAALNDGRRIDYVLQEAPLESFNEYLFALASHLCYWESEDTCLMVLKDIYAQVQVFTDDDNVLKHVPYLNTSTNPPKLEQKTPSVAPPASVRPLPQLSVYTPSPVPAMNAAKLQQMDFGGPNFSSPIVPTTGLVGPPPTLFSPSNVGPSPIAAPHPSAAAAMMSPMGSLPSLKSSAFAGGAKSGYPKPPAMTIAAAVNPPSTYGMDPTAPLVSDRPIAPPPMSGYYKKQ